MCENFRIFYPTCLHIFGLLFIRFWLRAEFPILMVETFYFKLNFYPREPNLEGQKTYILKPRSRFRKKLDFALLPSNLNFFSIRFILIFHIFLVFGRLKNFPSYHTSPPPNMKQYLGRWCCCRFNINRTPWIR